MSQTVTITSLHERLPHHIAATLALAHKAVVPEIDSKQVATLQSALYALGTRFKERTAELETQVMERCKAEECIRELASRMLQLQDDLARRLARELHDSVGQYLAAIQMNLSAMERDSLPFTPSQAKWVSNSIEMVTCCTTEIRTMSYLLHPPLLDEMGLTSALAEYTEGFAERSGIRVDLDISKDFKRLPADTETAMFRIVQQSLANIYRHSGSQTAKIKIRQDAEQVILTISDEGHGMNPEVLKESDSGTRFVGVGIAGMRERIRIMSGRFHISSSRDGTILEISLPIIENTDHASS